MPDWIILTIVLGLFWLLHRRISTLETDQSFQKREISNLWNALGKVSGENNSPE